MRGKTYQFIANGISTFHPFMIIYNKGTVSSSAISGNSGSFTITMSIDDNENSYYRCLNHSGMKGNLSFLYGTVDNFEYNFYYGDIDVIVDNDFKKVSIYCYYHGFMGGQDLLIYTANCEIPEPESEPESESESEPEESEPESEEYEPESEPEPEESESESEPEPEESEPESEPEESEPEPESEESQPEPESEPETDIILGPINIVYATQSNTDNTLEKYHLFWSNVNLNIVNYTVDNNTVNLLNRNVTTSNNILLGSWIISRSLLQSTDLYDNNVSIRSEYNSKYYVTYHQDTNNNSLFLMNINHITDYNLTLFEIEYLDSRYVDSSFNLIEYFTNYNSEENVIEKFTVSESTFVATDNNIHYAVYVYLELIEQDQDPTADTLGDPDLPDPAIYNHIDISNWDTSNVTNMSYLFAGSGRDTWLQNLGMTSDSSYYQFYDGELTNNSTTEFWSGFDISQWNTSNVTDMSYMFSHAYVFNQDVSSWNTSNVTDMSYMFSYAYVFNQDITSWNTSNVTNFTQMFSKAYDFNQDIRVWNVQQDLTTVYSGGTFISGFRNMFSGNNYMISLFGNRTPVATDFTGPVYESEPESEPETSEPEKVT